MDYSCRDIPMRLDIRYQPLNFDIYLSQVINIPYTSLNEEPYNFQLENNALEIVNNILERTQKEQELSNKKVKTDIIEPIEPLQPIEPSSSSVQLEEPSNHLKFNQQAMIPTNVSRITPTCPTDDTPLTPIRTSSLSIPMIPQCNTIIEQQKSSIQSENINQINPEDFEDIHYNPFDQIELQTIDELKELDLVFQASYANNQTNGNQLQQVVNDVPSTSENIINNTTLTK